MSKRQFTFHVSYTKLSISTTPPYLSFNPSHFSKIPYALSSSNKKQGFILDPFLSLTPHIYSISKSCWIYPQNMCDFLLLCIYIIIIVIPLNPWNNLLTGLCFHPLSAARETISMHIGSYHFLFEMIECLHISFNHRGQTWTWHRASSWHGPWISPQ